VKYTVSSGIAFREDDGSSRNPFFITKFNPRVQVVETFGSDFACKKYIFKIIKSN